MTQFGTFEGGFPIPVGGAETFAVPEGFRAINFSLSELATVPAVITVAVKNGSREVWRRTFDVNGANDSTIPVYDGESINVSNAADSATAVVNAKWSDAKPVFGENTLFFGQTVAFGVPVRSPAGAIWLNFCFADPGYTATNAKQTQAATASVAGQRVRAILPAYTFGGDGGIIWELSNR